MVENIDNSTTLTNSLFTSLTAGITIPASVDFSDDKFSYSPSSTDYKDSIKPVDVSQITDADPTDGQGIFDVIMRGINAQIDIQYEKGRVSGKEFADVYIASLSQALSQSISFVLQREQTRWNTALIQSQAKLADIQTTQGLVELERAKFEAANSSFAANTTAANYALTKMKIATEEASHNAVTQDAAIKSFQLEELQPLEKALQQHMLNVRAPIETDLIKEQRETQRANTLGVRSDNMTPISGSVGLQNQIAQLEVNTRQYVYDNQLPLQTSLVGKQVDLTQEQIESERAKTLDTRSDDVTAVAGSVGKQKDLYTQQIDSFIKDAQYKVAKMHLDGWITQKTLDEGLNAPDQLTNANIDAVISKVVNNNNLV